VRVGSLNESGEEGLSEAASRGAESVGVGGSNESDRAGRKGPSGRASVGVGARV
jgi:hypothetical protein